MASIYLHLPYCLYKCHYCDFNSYATKPGNIPFGTYAQAVLNELDFRLKNEAAVAAHLSTPLETIFLGGGTPSLFPPKILKGLLEEIIVRLKNKIPSPLMGEGQGPAHLWCSEGPYPQDMGEGEVGTRPLAPSHHPIKRDVSRGRGDYPDITMEANPGTISQKTIEEFTSVAGVTRLSLGVQSLHDKYLGKYGRIHSAEDALQAISWIKSAGFQSWSCDLMFGFPQQTSDEWKWELEKILTYDPPHLSCYAFTVEKEAPYGRQVALGNAPVPDEDIQAEMFEWTRDFLTQSGYVGYEISNFAKPGYESQHNLNYWNYGSYLGLGAGAVSFLHSSQGLASPPPTGQAGLEPPPQRPPEADWLIKSPFEGYRQMGLKTPDEYLKQWGNIKSQVTDHGAGMTHSYENIFPTTAMSEFMMMGLRLKQGVSAQNFQKLFGVKLEEHFADPIAQARQKGWMCADQFSLTPQGFQMANQVVGLFL